MIRSLFFSLVLLLLAAWASAADRPNIVVFLSDDHGYADSGAYGDDVVRTPNIDRLAAEGMRFSYAFAENPLCSPSRACIVTGLYPFRNGAHQFGTQTSPGVRTLPAYFKRLGYYTAHFGKFHHAPAKALPYDTLNKEKNAGPFEANVERFIRSYKKDKPLMLMVCAWPPHQPWVENTTYDPDQIKLPPNFVDTPKTREIRAKYYSDVTLMDSMLGRVRAALEDRDMLDNTLFVYTTDQGAMWPFGKWCVYDDGLRVPFIVRGEGIKPGSTSDAMVQLIDLLPTLIEAAGGKLLDQLDGRSILPVLHGERVTHREMTFATHTQVKAGGSGGLPNNSPARSVRTRNLRYILNLWPDKPFVCGVMNQRGVDNHYWPTWVEKAKTDAAARTVVEHYTKRPPEELYDVRTDPYQLKNLIDEPAYAEHRDRLRAAMAEWRKQQGDLVPARPGRPAPAPK